MRTIKGGRWPPLMFESGWMIVFAGDNLCQRRELNMILTGLNHDEKQFYRELAMSKAGTDEDLDLYFRDEVVYARFGPIKLARYLNE